MNISAFSFSDFLGATTVNAIIGIDPAGNCKNVYYNLSNEPWNGTNNVRGVYHMVSGKIQLDWILTFLCSEGNFYACGWSVINNPAATNVNVGDKRGSWTCSSSGWISNTTRDCKNIVYGTQLWNGTDNLRGVSHLVSGKIQIDWRPTFLCSNTKFYACGWSLLNDSVALNVSLGTRQGDWYCTTTGWDNTPLSRSLNNPVLVGTEQWEKGSSLYYNVFEPTVVIDPNAPDSQRYKMLYSAGWANGSTGLAYSADLIHWTKYANNPVIGQANMYPGRGSGINGITNRNSVIYDNGYWYIYYNVGTPRGDLRRSRSTDFIHWTPDGNDVNGTVIGRYSKPWSWGWHNTGVWKDDGGLWHLYVDGYKNQTKNQTMYGQVWFEAYATSADGKNWIFSPDSTSAYFEPMSSLRITTNISGNYGSLTPPKFFRGKYYVFYHGGDGLPSQVYLASSVNINGPWEIYKNSPVLKIFNENNISDVAPIDQLADVWWLEDKGKLYLFYDVDNNADENNGKVHISLATYDGTFADLINELIYGSAPYCGDNSCRGDETCSNCETDCGDCCDNILEWIGFNSCFYCGDGHCNNGETALSCLADCKPAQVELPPEPVQLGQL